MYIESAKTANEMTLNDVVKLTTLWTTGPWLCYWSLQVQVQLRPTTEKFCSLSSEWVLFEEVVVGRGGGVGGGVKKI